MNKVIHAAVFANLVALASPAHAAIDGKVDGLNEQAFATLSVIKVRNPGALTEAEARQLGSAIMADKVVDPVERDLLEELTQSLFRSIVVTPAGAAPNTTRSVRTYPISGNAKRALQEVLNPPLDLADAWGKGVTGWKNIGTEYNRNPVQAARVVAFVQGRVLDAWALSNMGNGYKPLRDLIAQRYGFSHAPGGDVQTGRTLLYKACTNADQTARDAIPDFLYNWTRPGGYL